MAFVCAFVPRGCQRQVWVRRSPKHRPVHQTQTVPRAVFISYIKAKQWVQVLLNTNGSFVREPARDGAAALLRSPDYKELLWSSHLTPAENKPWCFLELVPVWKRARALERHPVLTWGGEINLWQTIQCNLWCKWLIMLWKCMPNRSSKPVQLQLSNLWIFLKNSLVKVFFFFLHQFCALCCVLADWSSNLLAFSSLS